LVAVLSLRSVRSLSILAAIGVDKAFGEAGNDVFSGDEFAAGTAVGGEGIDTATYEGADRPVIVCRETPIYSFNISNWAPERMIDIERYVGSPFGDTLEGTSGRDVLIGRHGRDVLVGHRGDDRLIGGQGDDRFFTRDRVRDEINGGVGRDLAKADADDLVRSAKRSNESVMDPCA
jgi:hypothetical protein